MMYDCFSQLQRFETPHDLIASTLIELGDERERAGAMVSNILLRYSKVDVLNNVYADILRTGWLHWTRQMPDFRSIDRTATEAAYLNYVFTYFPSKVFA